MISDSTEGSGSKSEDTRVRQVDLGSAQLGVMLESSQET